MIIKMPVLTFRNLWDAMTMVWHLKLMALNIYIRGKANNLIS